MFRTKTDLESDGWSLSDHSFVKEGNRQIPLYESKLFHQYNHRYATFEGVSEQDVEEGDAKQLTEVELDDPTKFALPRYWIPEKEYNSKSDRDWHIALRNITRATDERTSIFTILPRVASGHSLNHVSGPDAEEALLLVACFNSFALDFVARQKVGGTHLSQFIARQLPIPSPERFSEVKLDGKPIRSRIKELTLQLCYHSHDLSKFADEVGYEGEPYQYTKPNGTSREDVRYELEALMCHLYGINQSMFDHLFDSFAQIKRNDISDHGYYRTRDEIKAQFEEIAPRITDQAEVKE
jgi:hypothetical protein